jgi:flagellar motor switch protein FliM
MEATAARPQTNIRDLLMEAANLSLDQLPLLPVIFDRVGQQLSDRLRSLSSALPHVSLNELTTARIGEVLDAYEMRAVVGIFHAVSWDARVLVSLDRDFVYTLMEMMLGGDGSEPPAEDVRNLSSIEVQFSQFVLDHIGQGLQAAFAPLSNTRFRLERTETRMDFAGAGRRSLPAVVGRFILQAMNRGGEMLVIIPQAALAPLRQPLSRFPVKDTAPADPTWARKINDEVRRTEVAIRAIAETSDLTLGDLASLRVGQVITLDATTQSRIKVESGDQSLFWAFLGQNEGRYTLCIDESIDQEREFMNDVLAG